MASYQQACEWIAGNDDCYWIGDDEPIMSVSACMVRDLWNKSDEQIVKDIKKWLKKVHPNHEILRRI